MAVELNHTIVTASDAEASARWFAELFGLAAPQHVFGYFWQVSTANGVALDFADAGDGPIVSQHYAFLVSEAEFDSIYATIVERGADHWADPSRHHSGEVNHHDGGRGVYFLSPEAHLLEIITRPYGSGS